MTRFVKLDTLKIQRHVLLRRLVHCEYSHCGLAVEVINAVHNTLCQHIHHHHHHLFSSKQNKDPRITIK